jgi:hypothetical protein
LSSDSASTSLGDGTGDNFLDRIVDGTGDNTDFLDRIADATDISMGFPSMLVGRNMASNLIKGLGGVSPNMLLCNDI